MSDDTNKLVSEQDYDGIQEYDNPLPLWWLVTFLATIFFGFHYYLHFVSGAAISQNEELRQDLAQIKALKGPDSTDTEDELLALSHSPEALKAGHDVFMGKCAACHGPELQGLIGPNLVDEFWIHGQGRLSDITAVIRSGVPDKGMPVWGEQLKNDEIKAVAVYIASKAGSDPPQAKPPQGEKVVKH